MFRSTLRITIAKPDRAGVAELLLESAMSTIIWIAEDSVALWMPRQGCRLMATGWAYEGAILSERSKKGGQQVTREMNDDPRLTPPGRQYADA